MNLLATIMAAPRYRDHIALESDAVAAAKLPGMYMEFGVYESLPPFLASHPGNVAFAHLDSDLYSSTNTVLQLADERFVPGTVLLFDEIITYPGFEQHEYKALTEFLERRNLDVRVIGYSGQVAAFKLRECRLFL